MFRRVDASMPKPRSQRFLVSCAVLAVAAACNNGAGTSSEDQTASQAPGAASQSEGTNTGTTQGTSGTTSSGVGSSAVSQTPGSAGSGAATSTTMTTMTTSTTMTTTAGSGAAGTSAVMGAAGTSASAAAERSAPTDPGVPPDVAEAWNEWPLPGRDYNNSRYTQDTPINSSNVSSLKEAWRVELPGLVIAYGMCSTVPLIIGGTVYLEDTYSSVRAIDLASGDVKWSVSATNLNAGPNGVAVGWGKVFAIRGSDSVVAYDAESGKELWVKRVVDTSTAGIDIQPTVYGGQVLVSTVPISTSEIYGPGDRGILKALDQETGEERWRFDTIESPDSVWGNDSVNSGGGSWYPPSIDLTSGRVFWAVANPAPFPGTPEFPNGSSRPGANLYTDSTVVLDVKSGEYQWHHQTVEHDLFDRDLLHTMLTEASGVPIVISTGKEGRVWANRRDNGEVVWGPVSVGMHKNDELLELTAATEVLPGSFGGVLTPPALADGVVYVAELNAPTMYSSNQTAYFGSQIGSMSGDLVAIDAATGEILWDTPVDGDPTGGVTVVNDLVITATFQGDVIAYQRDSGKEAWRWKAPGGINSWLTVSGDTMVIPVGAANPAVVVALRLGDAGTSNMSSAGTGAAGSGAAGGPATAADPYSFSGIYTDILSKRCAGPVCHSGSSAGGSLDVSAGTASALRTSLLNQPATGSECAASALPLVTPGQPDQSLLYRKLEAMPPCGSRMPPTGALPQEELDRIRTWIANGALND